MTIEIPTHLAILADACRYCWESRGYKFWHWQEMDDDTLESVRIVDRAISACLQELRTKRIA